MEGWLEGGNHVSSSSRINRDGARHLLLQRHSVWWRPSSPAPGEFKGVSRYTATKTNKQTNKKQRLHAVSVEGNEINHLSMDVSGRGTLLYKEREGIESTCGEW